MSRTIHTLPNGLRIVAERSDGHVAYIGVLTNAGSRDDLRHRDGIAHFVEHTIFKGTASRSSLQISNRMENIGGELNAYTTKEEIMIYTNSPAGYEERAIELLADLVINSEFPAVEIDRERSVILEEINSYRDNPMYAVFDEFDEFLYKGSRLAHNILGYPESVSAITRDDARNFLTTYFAPANMVIYCVAPSDPERNIRLIEKYFGDIRRPSPMLDRTDPQINPVFEEVINDDNHQANVLIGTRIFGASDPRRYSLFLLSNILGGPAMNSLLTRKLREQRGLVYTVDTTVALYSNAGSFQIYFACEPSNIKKCAKIIKREIDSLASKEMTQRRFGVAQRQLCGQLLVSGDNRESCAMGYAKSLMRHGKVNDNKHTADMIMQLSAKDLRDMAELIATRPLSQLSII